MVKGKHRLIIMLVLTIFFFVLLVTFLIAGFGFTGGMWIIYSLVILLAAISLGVAMYTNNKITARVKDLPEAYKNMYFNAQDLLGVYTRNLKLNREISEMILEIFEHASLEKRSVDVVVGNDLESYIKQFLPENKTNYNPLNIFLYSASLFTFFLIFMKIYKVVRVDNTSIESFQTETLDMGITLTYFIISFGFYPLLMYMIHRSAKMQWTGFKRWLIAIPLLIPILLMSGLIFIENDALRSFLDQDTIIFGNMLSFVIGIVILIILTSLTIVTKD